MMYGLRSEAAHYSHLALTPDPTLHSGQRPALQRWTCDIGVFIRDLFRCSALLSSYFLPNTYGHLLR